MTLTQKIRSAGEAERTLSPASGLFDEAADEIERLTRETERLDRDLFRLLDELAEARDVAVDLAMQMNSFEDGDL